MNTLKAPGIKFGLIGFLIQFGCFVLFYRMGVDYFLGVWVYLPWLIMMVLAFMAGLEEWKLSEDRLLPYSRALITVFTVMLIAEFGAILAEYLIYNVLDPNYHEIARSQKLADTERWMQRFARYISYAEGDKEEIMETARRMDYHFYIMSAVFKFLVILCVDFFFALILAAILRKEPKVSERSN